MLDIRLDGGVCREKKIDLCLVRRGLCYYEVFVLLGVGWEEVEVKMS